MENYSNEKDKYDVGEIINFTLSRHIDISPADRGRWAVFCCALKTLDYSVETFVQMSSGDPQASRERWRNERHPERYFKDTNSAKGYIISLAKQAGIDLNAFRLEKEKNNFQPQKWGKKVNAVTEVNREQHDEKPPIFVEDEVINAAAKQVTETTLCNYLCRVLPCPYEVKETMKLYRVGATKEFGNTPALASAFPYININGKCVDIHLQPYEVDGHRRRDGYNQNWLLCKRKQSDRRAPWCLFGEHLLTERPTAPVGVVESEKTAIIAATFAPQYVWVATASLANLNARRLAAAKDRELYLFPDNDGVTAWSENAAKLSAAGFRVYLCSEFIQAHAINPKDDLGDILLNAFLDPKNGNK